MWDACTYNIPEFQNSSQRIIKWVRESKTMCRRLPMQICTCSNLSLFTKYMLSNGSRSNPSNVQDYSPHMSFILKGSQISALQLKGWFNSKTSIQEYENGNTKLIFNLCMNYMVHVSSTMWRIKNQSSNSISCSDNALRLLVLVMGILCWGLQVTSSFSNWGCVLKGGFERGIFWRAKLRLKGIEDFKLEQWSQGSLHIRAWGPLNPWCTNYVIGREAGDSPSSLYTILWRLEEPKKVWWMKNLHDALYHGRKWTMLHGLLDVALGSTKRGGSSTY